MKTRTNPFLKSEKRFVKSGFTLVELLVVVAIIAVLATITFMVAKRLHQSSQRIVCASNMKQVGAAIYLYAGDNNGLLPYSFGGSVSPQKVNNKATNWNHAKVANDLSPYIDDKVWDCPDPLNRANRQTTAAFGIVWTKGSSALTSPWQVDERKAHRLLEYADASKVHLFYCAYCNSVNGNGSPGNRPWPHGGKINRLYLDGHVDGNYRPTWPD